MELGVILPTMSRRDGRPGDIPAAARQAEERGFESVWSVDQLVAGTGVPVLDSLTVLAAAAAVTQRVKLGVGVLIVPLRPVAWTAKQVATLQYLSGDRVLLGTGPRRFTELHREVDEISQRMLTLTLRHLERDGLVTRTVHPVVPPRVDYVLTDLGRGLLVAIEGLVAWTRAHRQEIADARSGYDARRESSG